MQKPSNRLIAKLREPVTVAIFTATLVTAVLAFALLAIWTGAPGAPGPQPGTAGQLAAVTPTPRTINWPKTPPAATPPAVAPAQTFTPASAEVPAINALAPEPPAIAAPTATTAAADPEPSSPAPELAQATAPPPTSSPAPTAPPEPAATATVPPTATPKPTAEPDFIADDEAAFAAFAVEPWSTSGDTLVHKAAQAIAEPMLLLPYTAPSGDFAIEAEIRVDGLAPNVCNQNFGLVAGSEATGQFFGGGVIYACGASSPAARITDVSDWTNGYDQDRQLARGSVNPGDDWRHYRFEVRGDEFRLLVDGTEVLSATESTLGEGFSAGKGGVWTQGTRLSVRNVMIFAL